MEIKEGDRIIVRPREKWIGTVLRKHEWAQDCVCVLFDGDKENEIGYTVINVKELQREGRLQMASEKEDGEE